MFLVLLWQKPKVFGDTIKVQAFTFDSTTRDTLISFPDFPELSFEKIILKYTMRCKDGLISTTSDRNKGCGEMDYSCNTYLVDSSKNESVDRVTASDYVTNIEGNWFAYKETPAYDYIRTTQHYVSVDSLDSELQAVVGEGVMSLSDVLKTDNGVGKTQYLYLASELSSMELIAGELNAIGLNVLSSAGEASFLKIKIKHTQKTELNPDVDLSEFTEVYYHNVTLLSDQLNRFNFSTPFVWDGSSNIIVEFSFLNLDNENLTESLIEGHNTDANLGICASNEQHMYLTNDAYIECDDYVGVLGSQNRTVEAWIKTSADKNAEICSWGTNTSYQKWVFRLTNTGSLRVENAAGGIVSATKVNDGTWHHIACVLDGDQLGDIDLYVDGVLSAVESNDNTSINTSANENVRISKGVNNRYLDAEIDELRIWDTNLSLATLNQWMRIKLDSTHFDYANLQLNYDFSGSGKVIEDLSTHERNAKTIGGDFRISDSDGENLFKEFVLTKTRPNAHFYQGEYYLSFVDSLVDKPIEKEIKYFAISRSIESTEPNVAAHDIIHTSEAVEYWLPVKNIYNEADGALISTENLEPDGEIVITNLHYFNRYPFYNELVSFVTPYGIGLNFGMDGKSWYFDMSDYVQILKGDKRIVMTLGGQWQEDMDLEFQFIVGTPPRNVLQYEQLWQGTNRTGVAQIQEILDDVKLAPIDFAGESLAESFKLKSSITGHGAEGEFQQNGGEIIHLIAFDSNEKLNWNITQECSTNPIYPQGGTWVYDRQGWCPGERTLHTEADVTDFIAPDSIVNIDYTTSFPLVSNGSYKYHIAHQLVGYSSPNHQLDAAVVDIIAPNNGALYTRVGTVCANPTIIIQNTGADVLTSLNIEYWLNESQSPLNYQRTGDLEFMEEEEVFIPSPKELWYDILDDNNMFYVSISEPNGNEDEYAYNNSLSSAFDVPEILPSNVTIDFKTNSRPYENKYVITNAGGDTIGMNDLPDAGTIYSDDYNLANDCYKLIVEDTGGDGVHWWANVAQGTGYIRLKDGNGVMFKIFEPDFGGGFEYSFSVNTPITHSELEFLTSIKVFPNPVDDYCTIQMEKADEVEVFMTNLLGQRFVPSIVSVDNSTMHLNVEDLNSGIYILTVLKGEIRTTRKIVKN